MNLRDEVRIVHNEVMSLDARVALLEEQGCARPISPLSSLSTAFGRGECADPPDRSPALGADDRRGERRAAQEMLLGRAHLLGKSKAGELKTETPGKARTPDAFG
ncbi:unnamed protein product [Durusdinium trenchii]|uniref:Uncharacterized protein n=1 Tax=Durusdinium trenchii TaxID=1381693 RepID=A0ABP0KMH5_9DINO